MNTAVIELQRDLLLNQLMEIENQLNENGMKKGKKGFTLFMRNGFFYVKYTCLTQEEADLCNNKNVKIGKQIPTNRCLDTADRKEAESLAVNLRESIIKSYIDNRNNTKDITAYFSDYYKIEKSADLQELLKNGKGL
jgi:hypothetical protein